jgi:outer membrane protein OmpA-like peptidoglycan-associated protein
MEEWGPCMRLVALLIAASLLASGAAMAEDSTSAVIIDALTPKVKTRGIGGSVGLNGTEAAFVDELRTRTRGITIVEREQLAEIVEEKRLPSIDIDIFFAYNSAAIAPEAMPGLVELGTALRSEALAQSVILLSGHTDAKGSDDYNQTLSEQRAQSVKAFLVETFRFPEQNLIAVGYGEQKLKNPVDPEAADNRRVQIVNLQR